MTGGVQDWSLTAGSNGSIDPNINFSEGQSPPSLNNSARALMAAMRALYDAIGGGITYGGSGNTYTATNASIGAWTAYAEGQIIGFEPNATNSGAATLNVDTLGAKSIVKGASTALASGDLVQGAFYLLRYDGTNFCIIGSAGAGAFQPLDATLTALAALSWSSGQNFLTFTAADTVSLTNTISMAGLPARFVNTTDNASVQGLRIEGDRATPASGDGVYASFYLSDAAGNQDEIARIAVVEWDATSTSEDGEIDFHIVSAGTLAARAVMTATAFRPNANDGMALGTATVSFSDLFLASGAVLNFNNGDVTVTHSSNALEVAGGGFAAPLLASSETTGTLTVASRNRIVNCTGNITLDDGVFAAEDWMLIAALGSARTITRAAGLTMYVNGTDSATATLAANMICGVRWRSATVCELTGPVT